VPNIWQFMCDITVMGVSFTLTQNVGFGLLFTFYGALGARYLIREREARRRRPAVDDEFEKI
jgi:hypothetical protein